MGWLLAKWHFHATFGFCVLFGRNDLLILGENAMQSRCFNRTTVICTFCENSVLLATFANSAKIEGLSKYWLWNLKQIRDFPAKSCFVLQVIRGGALYQGRPGCRCSF